MCEGIQDSLGFCIQNCRFLDSGFQLLMGIRFLELYHGFQSQGFWIPQVKFSRRIQDSTNNNFQDSGFRKQKFPGYRNPLNVGKERKATKNIPVAEDLNSIIDCFFNPVVFFVMLYKVTHIYQFFRQEDDCTT